RPARPADAGGDHAGAGCPAARWHLAAAARAARRGVVRDRRGRGAALPVADRAGAAGAALVERGLSRLTPRRHNVSIASPAGTVRLMGGETAHCEVAHNRWCATSHAAPMPPTPWSLRRLPHPQEDPMFDAAFTPRRRAVLVSMAGVPVLLTACAKTTEDGDGPGGSGDGGGGGTITVGTTDKVTALDPAAAYDNGSSTVWTQCYSYLLNTSIGSEDGRPEPDLAETAEFTSDTVFTVTLQEGLTFANGNDLTTEDVKHTFDRQLAIADPNGPSDRKSTRLNSSHVSIS